MASSGTPQLSVPVFAGQGTTAANTTQTRQQAFKDASSPSGSILLSACHEAFHAELSALSPSELTQANIDIADFKNKASLLSIPDRRYFHNPIISGTTLFLIQALRYLAFIEISAVSTDSLTPFSDVLKSNMKHGMGVLGFSSGILPACVVGTSLSAVTYISRAVEAYRLAIWIGVRAQIYRTSTLGDHTAGNHSTALPWSLVFLGISRQSAEDAIAKFMEDAGKPSLYITAVTDDMCVTISGRPDILAAFSETLTVGSVVHKTTLDTLYHASVHLEGAREQVLADVIRRNIEFPDFSDIKVPIRSTFTGEALTSGVTSGSLVELVVDMLLTQPVNWNVVMGELVKSLPTDFSLRFLNVGPGSGLVRSMERAFPCERVSSLDLTVPDTKGTQQGKPKQVPIAIVGMAVNMPGAPNATKLWEVLEQGINTVAEIPEHRFTVTDYNNATDAKSKRTMKAHTGNFIDGVDEFDNKFFKISPREARSMDPQQRVLLHTAYEALENAGYVPDATPTFRPETFGCYIGVATHDYLQNLRDDIDVYYSTGTLKSFLSGRISYAMQLSGPSIVVDTACSSSNVALYQGARALMNRDCNAAMVGGVNIVSSPDMFLGLDRGHFLSPTGQCKAFDASADGYSRSEGCGIFVLKRLSDAVAENDNILGVIRGVEVNQSGLAHSITHPHAPTQASLFKQVLENTGIDANRINVVEAHGTGTQAGDPNELESIRSVFATHRTPSNPLHITSVKGNIGHLEAASGAAGLAKLLLMLQRKQIPRQISLKNLNPRIASLESDNTIIDTTNVPWVPSHEGMTRIAMLNNFGAAGSNTALLLEEFCVPTPVLAPTREMPYVFGLSAKTEAALDKLRSRYLQWLQSPESEATGVADIAYTATARRQIYNYRLSVSASTKGELVEKLLKSNIVQPTDQTAQAVFVFSGQGGQYIGMGRSLYQTSSLFRHHVDECHSVVTTSGFPGVLQIINPDAGGSGLTALEEFEAYQAAIFSLQYALAKLWISWGLMPAAVVGHSIGEYAALVIANVLTLKGALLIVANRVRFMVQKCEVQSTGMIAVNLDSAAVKAALGKSKDFSELTISCYNGPVDCVVSGPILQLKAFKQHLDAEVHCKNILLTVPFGYHSSAMTPLLADLTRVAKQVTVRAPTIPVVSNVFGETVLPLNTSVFNAEYFSRHCAEPVLFEKGIRSLTSQPAFTAVDAWIEIGPHTTSLPMLKSNTALSKGTLLLGSLRKQQDAWSTLTASLSQLYVSNFTLRWREVFAHLTSVSCVSLPSYPFAKTKFWVPFKETIPAIDVAGVKPEVKHLISEYSMLHAWAQYPAIENGFVAVFETPISQLARSIRGHSVGGMPLCPASVYIEQVFAGIDLAKRYLGVASDGSHVVLRGIEFIKPLVYDEAVDRTVTTSVTLNGDVGVFSISSRVNSSAEEHVHVHGGYRFQPTFQTLTKFSRTLPVISRRIAAILKPNGGAPPEIFSTRTAYEVIFPRIVDYAKEYHTMQSLVVDASGMEGCANVKLPRDYDRAKFVVHPVFMDTLLHVAGFVANMQGGINDAYICSEVGTVKVIPELVDNDAAYSVYCNNAWLPEEGIMLAEAYATLAADPEKVVAHLKGMHFRRVRLNSLKRGLAHAAGNIPLPLAPTSNVSKPPPAHTSPMNTTSSTSRDALTAGDIQNEVMKVVSGTCDINAASIDVNTNLASLGVDSLMSIEIFGKLQTAFPKADLDANALSFCQSITDIVCEVCSKLKSSQAFDRASPARQAVSVSSSPLTLVSDEKLPEPTPLIVDGEPDVKRILASVLDVSVRDIGDDADFESLGLDSLTSIEALHALKNEFGLELPGDFFNTCPTARSVQSCLSSRLRATTQLVKPVVTEVVDIQVAAKVAEISLTNISRIAKALRLDTVPVSVQQSSTRGHLPLFLIHDGSGLVNYYERLPPLDRDIWGIHNPHFVTSQPWDSVIQMATTYADHILSQTSTPVILGGWSFGGVAAYEAALQVMKKGVLVKGILLIDSPSPINHAPLSDSLIDSVVNLDVQSANSELGRLVKTQFAMNARMLGKYDPYVTGGSCPPLVLLRSSEGYNSSGVTDVPIWLADRSDPKVAAAGWDTLSTVKVFDIPGHHFQPFHPSHIAEVSRRIAEGCAYLENL